MKTCLAALAAAMLWACDLSQSPRGNLLSLKLDDSLSAYDSIRVDILYPDGQPYREAVFHGKYVPASDHLLDDLDLGKDPPAAYQVLITAFRDTARALVYGVKVGPQGAEPPQVLVRNGPPGTEGPRPGEIPPLRVVLVTPAPLALTVGGPAAQAVAEVQPEGAYPGISWSSSDTGVVRVDGAGMLFPEAPGTAEIKATSRRDPALYAVLRVTVSAAVMARGLSLKPDHAVLYVGGPPLQLDAQATPAEAQADVGFASRNPAVAKVSPAGLIAAVEAGSVDVVAFPRSEPSMTLTCHVTVKRDVPRLELGGDRPGRVGDTLAFPIKVIQEFGAVAMLKWDLDGDGIWEDSVAAETAAPRHAYDGKDTLVTAIFEARDSEGNVAQDFLFVHVGTATRLLPPGFTAATTASPTGNPRPTWAWSGGGTGRFRISLDGGPEREVRDTSFTADTLPVGAHTLSLRAIDAFGSSSPTVTRTLVVMPAGPQVVIQSPAEGYVTNADLVEVAWTEEGADGNRVWHGDSEDLSGRQGAIALVRSARDSLGHEGADTVVIFRDTVPPAAPAFLEASAPALVNAAYAEPVRWVWTRADAEGDRFLIWLNGMPKAMQAETTFTLPSPPDGTYLLEVREIDSAGNASASAGRSIVVDRLPPPPPVLSGSGGAGGPSWSWSAAPASDGKRIFRYRLTTAADWSPETAATAFALPGAAAGNYTLQVQERDAAGNWSPPGSFSLATH